MVKLLTLLFGLIIVAVSGYLLLQNKSGSPSLPLPTNNKTEVPKTTGENIEILATNLEIPWSLAFLPDGSALFTERAGRIRGLDKLGKLTNLSLSISGVKHIGEGGLLGLAIDPEFNSNKYIYVYYTFSESNGNTLNRVVRYKFENNTLTEEKILVSRIPGGTNHNGGRLKFGPDGLLYVATGDSGNPSLSQDRDSLAGKILSIDGDENVRVFSYGHRNPQGLAWNSEGLFYATEHGPLAHDELNRITEGANYGWPTIQGTQKRPGMMTPIAESGLGTWAPSGTEFYKDRLFFAGLRGVALYEAKIVNESVEITEHFKNEFGRIRDVVLGPDNMLYILTNNTDGRGSPGSSDDRIIRINPASF